MVYHENTKHPNHYFARYAKPVWHTELHYLTTLKSENYFQVYLIVFIDDRTRKILYEKILPYKSSYCTSRALKTALETNDPPKYVITDNGKEFISQDFVNVLNDYNIELLTNHPYTPEENGKCERFWSILEKGFWCSKI